MKKKFISIIGATILLTGCGSQNLGPLEQKTTKLR
ncbi:lipoprotein, partial [Agathobacter rectalis]